MTYESQYYNPNYLAHFGILGMRWGIRRYQNRDGSLTSAGKKRYSTRNVVDDFDKSIETHGDAYRRVIQGNTDIPEAADNLMKDYEKAFNDVKIDAEAKSRIISNLKNDFGNRCNDPELFEMYLTDYVDEEIMSKVNDTVKNKRDAFEKQQDAYWNDVSSIVTEIKDKYKGQTIHDIGMKNDGQLVINDLIGKKLDTGFNSYIYRHFDDYWVYDTDAHYNARERVSKELGITMDEYNKRYAGT